MIRHLLISLFLFIGIFLLSTNANAQLIKTHRVLVIDKTGSMTGAGDGGGINIWPDVISAIRDYINQIPEGEDLTLFTFDEQPSQPFHYLDIDQIKKKAAIDYINSLTPDGRYTGIYRALDQAFDFVDKSNKKATIIYLFTDGHNNVDSMTINDVIDEFDAKRGEYDHCYYVQLRGEIPEAERELDKENPGFTTTRANPSNDDFKMVIIKPLFTTINKNLRGLDGNTFTVEQRYEIEGSLSENFKFKASIKYNEALANLDLIDKNELTISDNKALLIFEIVGDDIDFSSDNHLSIVVTNEVSNNGNGIINFQPAVFEINLSNSIGIVKLPAGGWK